MLVIIHRRHRLPNPLSTPISHRTIIIIIRIHLDLPTKNSLHLILCF